MTVGIESMLRDFISGYSPVGSETTDVYIQLDITPPGEMWYVVFGRDGGAELQSGSHAAPVATIKLSENTIARIHGGSLTAFTAGAKTSGDDKAPLEFEIHEAATSLRDARETLLGFLQHFFTRSKPERILLGEEYSRVVHGAHAIPLYYARGFRSAWYRINDGEHLNEPGDTNPFPQAFVVISGCGRAKIADSEIEIRAGESYYIPPGTDHVLTPATGQWLEVIWFAWGDGA
jgi:mannose-6-phosphate isomerase-like protein (cupin superfamily)